MTIWLRIHSFKGLHNQSAKILGLKIRVWGK